MFNPSVGGDKDKRTGKLIPDQADRTINKILEAFEETHVTGIHIRNLFTYRTPYPSKLIGELEKQMEIVDEKEAYARLGFVLENGDLAEWQEMAAADDCHLVVAAWGNCGEPQFKKSKTKVN